MKIPGGNLTEIITIICTVIFGLVVLSNTAGTYTSKIENNANSIGELNNIFKEMNSKISGVQTDVSWLKDTLQFIVLRHREQYHNEKMDEWMKKK